MIEALRNKNFIILALFMLATAVSVWLVSLPTPSIQTIVLETHKKISNLKNMNVMNRQKLPPEVNLDDTYLELLGFMGNPRLFTVSSEGEHQLPAIVAAVRSSDCEKAILLIESVQKYLSSHQIRLVDLELNSYELVKLKKHCNDTSKCSIKSFDFDKFPSYVRHDRDTSFAYKPIAIQETLMEFGAIIWASLEDYFITSELQAVLDQANSSGIVAWTIPSNDATSSVTHPKMFEYFKTRQSNYYFHRMVSSEHLVIYNTHRIHREIMLPWVQCVLTSDCLWPLGAQHTGCRYTLRPKYRYRGCHGFEVSALNVILGLAFNYDVFAYTSSAEIFGIEEPQDFNTTTARVPMTHSVPQTKADDSDTS